MVGHNHMQGFHVTKSIKEEEPLGWTFRAGSVGPNGNKNPVFNVIEFDEEFMVPVSIEVYSADIMKANREGKLTWEHYWSWTEDYGIEDLRPSNMKKFSEKIRDDEKTAIDFAYNQYRGGMPRKESCDESCRKGYFCRVSNSGPHDRKVCSGHKSKPSPFELLMDPWYEKTDSPW